MARPITAAMLYDYVKCPQRVALDMFGDPAQRDEIHPFVQLLWERGHAFELEVMSRLDVPFKNLREVPREDRERLTVEAMSAGEHLIYGGRIAADDLLGEPDLLRKTSTGYVPGDIKSGAGVEGGSDDSDGKPKKHYAVQLALYADILKRKGVLGEDPPFVWDVHGKEVDYDLTQPRGPRTPQSMWDEYQEALESTRGILSRPNDATPAMTSDCKLCHWRRFCSARLVEADDLTLLPELGRARRDKMNDHVENVAALAAADLAAMIKGRKTVIDGVGPAALERFHARAQLQKQPDPKPYFRKEVALPSDKVELFFDVETDPMQHHCYLHGFVERLGSRSETERYVAFVADTPGQDAEKAAFREAWNYVHSKQITALFFYSAYEKTTWKHLARRYPDVASEEQVESLFASDEVFDLYYGLTKPAMEWPTYDFSIKSIALFLGFKWRDPEPSGAASVRWYHQWLESEDPADRQRILDYNEDDCRAMRVLVDFVRDLQSRLKS